MRRYADLLPPEFRTADFIVAWRSARKLGGAIRYRMDQQADNASDDTTNDNTSPPPASQHGSEEECDEEETEANLSGGGVFLDRDADDFTFRLSQLPPGDGSSFGSVPILNPEVAGGRNASPHDTHGSR